MRIDVFRVGEQTPSEVSAAVQEVARELNARLPPTVRAAIWEDRSEILAARIQLLVKNASLGLILVLVLLGLSLDLRLAFWVTLGIPTSICGAVAFGLLVFCFGLMASGRIDFSFIPRVEAERVTAAVSMPHGTLVEETRKVQQRLLDAAREVLEAHGGDAIVRGVYSQVGAPPAAEGMVVVGEAAGGAHLTNVSVYLVPVDQRQVTAEDFVTEWHRRAGELPGVETLTFRYTTGPSSNVPINLRISHPDTATLERAASDLAASLTSYAGVRDINDGYSAGKSQLEFKINRNSRARW